MYIVPVNDIRRAFLHPPQILTQSPAFLKEDEDEEEDVYKEDFHNVDEVILFNCLSKEMNLLKQQLVNLFSILALTHYAFVNPLILLQGNKGLVEEEKMRDGGPAAVGTTPAALVAPTKELASRKRQVDDKADIAPR